MKMAKGRNKVYSDSRCSPNFEPPSEVWIKGEKKIPVTSFYTFNDLETFVKLVWNIPVTTCECMFSDCGHILEMNLTYFNTSQVNNMQSMFYNCALLTSIDLSNLDTSNVENMGNMFKDCQSLISLDVTNFVTSKLINIGTMFKNCISLTSLDISNFNTEKVTHIDNLFNGCRNLTSINLSNFNTSKVINMTKMFYDCISLTSVDISNFDTSLVTDMSEVFYNCILLTSINISNFKTTNVQFIDNMFHGCESLKIIDFSNFDSTSVTKMNDMFFNCGDLEYINFKNYNSDKTLDSNFFKGTPKNFVLCTESDYLINIIENPECTIVNCDDNWNDFRKKININDGNCIDDCTKTEYQYEYNFKCFQNCLNGTYNNNYICEDCHPDCRECEGPNNTNCISCSSSDKFLKFGNCVDSCKNDSYYYNETINQKICKCELDNCDTCSLESFNEKLCTSCKDGYYPIYDDKYDINYPFLNCSKSPEGYYLDISFYKLCYLSCKTCNISGNETQHNCIECKDGYFSKYIDLYKNCYENDYNTYQSNSIVYQNDSITHQNDSITYQINYDIYKGDSNMYQSDYNDYNTNHFGASEEISNFTESIMKCLNDYDKIIEEKNKCISSCVEDDEYKFEFRKHCYKECPLNSTERNNSNELDKLSSDKKYFCKPICSKEEPFEIINIQKCVKNCDFKDIIYKSCILNVETNKEYEKEEKYNNIYDIILYNVEISITSSNYNTTNLENGKDDVFEYENMTITLTTTENQKKNKNNGNITTVDLLGCETILRNVYNISDDEIVFIKKIDVIQEGIKISKVLYDVYSKLNGTNLVRLNLSYCSNTKIDISVPVILTESIDKHNSSSGYYNDICYKTTSDSGTDIILKDRQKEYIEKNRTICQENCIFSEYNYEIQKAKCSCNVVHASFSFDNIKINISKLYDNFVNIRNIVNINILVCYKILFSKKGISNNYGSISLIPLLFIHFIIILFYVKILYKKIEDKIEEISYGIKNWDLIKAERREKRRFKKRKRKNEIIKENEENDMAKNIIKEESNIIPQINTQNDYKNEKLYFNQPMNISKKDILNINKRNGINNNIEELKENVETININPEPKPDLNKAKKIMLPNDEELNNLKYKLALKIDKRTYCQYYISLLKTKHDIIFTFFNNTDYNFKIIKIDLFIFNFILNYAVNTLFFDDNTMHQIYEDKGSFNFIYHLPQIIYSSLIPFIVNIPLKMLALSEDLIIEFKKKKNKKDLEVRRLALNKKLKIKFILYYILSSIFLLFFWYYISMFCSIYVNTQIHLIKDTLISFVLSLIYPFGINLIPGICRIPALSEPENKKEYLYKLSTYIQLL